MCARRPSGIVAPCGALRCPTPIDAAGNLIALICGELMLQNAVGVLGCALLLWRIWRKIPGELAAWKEDRRLGGMAADLSGAIVVCAVGALCAFATWRIGLA